MQNIKEAVQELVSSIINDNENTGDIFSDILQTKISDRLDTLKKEVAENMFSSCDDCEAEVLTQEEFNALSEEEQAEYELVEIDDEEEVEQIDEISTATLQSYRQKAGQSAGQVDRDLHKAQTAKSPNPAAIKSAAAKMSRRVKGINTASNTLASRNEEVEQIDEISQFKKDEIAHELRHEEPSKSYRPRRGRMHPAAQKHYNDMLKRQSQEREKKAAEQKSSNS